MFWRKKERPKEEATPAVRPAAPSPRPAAPAAQDTRSSFLLGSDLSDRQRLDALFAAITRVTDAGSTRGANLQDLLAYLVDLAVEFTRAERGFLIEQQADGSLETRVARSRAADLPPRTRWPQSLVRRLLDDGQAVCTQIDPDNEQLDLGSSIIDMKLRAMMAVRLDALRTVDGQTLRGVLYVDSKQVSRTFAAGDLRFFQTLSAFIAIAARNADYRAALVQKAQQDRELEIVRSIRDDLNPAPIVHHPLYEVAAWAEAEDLASGDYYDWLVLPDGRLAVQCGDVTGHGVGSSLIMASATAATRAYLHSDDDPARIVAQVSRDLAPHLRTKTHLTCFLGIFGTDGMLRALNAGHTPPLHWRKATHTVDAMPDTHNAAIGFVDESFDWQAAAPRVIEPGDMVIMTSDGFTEARAQGSDDQLGEEGFAQLVQRVAPTCATPGAVVEALRSALLEYTGGRLWDDTTLVVVRRKTS
jgi:serine phosphatase RsbU (regulator of sigma subunit)